MEGALFSNNIFSQDVLDNNIQEEADNLNEETFGLCDDDNDFVESDWEKQHVALSKLIEEGTKRLNSTTPPRKYKSDVDVDVDLPTNLNSSFERREERYNSDVEEEELNGNAISLNEDIIENTISSLGLDDDFQYEVKTNSPTKSIAFEESHLSWTSPTRGKEHRSDSLQELISPGEGVWASPSRESDILWKSPTREDQSVWTSPEISGDDLWASPLRDELIGENLVQDVEKQINENRMQKLIIGNDDDFDNCPSPITPIRNVPTTPILSAIRVEDLERELIKEKKPTTQPTIIERHSYPPSTDANMNIPFPNMNPNENQMKTFLPGIGHMNITRMASLAMFNRHMMEMGNYSQMMHRGTPPPLHPPSLLQSPLHSPLPPLSLHHPAILSPYYLSNPAMFGKLDLYQPQQHDNYQKQWHSRTHRNDNNGFNGDHQYNRHLWHRELHPSNFKEIDYEQFIQMGPSRMMNAREKKWIFKISLMSLLGGDPNTNDYYFISHVTKNLESESKSENKDMRKTMEQTNQLVSYAHHQQQTKESHKPVKFKGSLGKLSITSVHHPRQIMDLSTPEQEAKAVPVPEESGKKKFVLYGMVENMYSILLSIMDMERELIDNKIQDEILNCRLEKIDELFHFFKIELVSSQKFSDTSHFGNLMSIAKGRKLLVRMILLFNQEQSESLFISVISVLPSLLKKDKEQTMLQFNEKVELVLQKSEKTFKLKCIKLLRKIDLKILLVYSTSILMLATLLDSLDEKNPSLSLEWSYYVDEVPKALLAIPEDVLLKTQPHLDHLKAILGIEKGIEKGIEE